MAAAAALGAYGYARGIQWAGSGGALLASAGMALVAAGQWSQHRDGESDSEHQSGEQLGRLANTPKNGGPYAFMPSDGV